MEDVEKKIDKLKLMYKNENVKVDVNASVNVKYKIRRNKFEINKNLDC